MRHRIPTSPFLRPGIWLLLMCCMGYARAQDTVIQLEPVRLQEWKIRESQLLLQEELRLAAPHRSVADHLQRQQGFYVRSQGNTVLTSASYKGLGSMHLPVLVGGYSIQSSMNGTLDLSLLSAFHFDRSHLDAYDIERNALANLGPEIHLQQEYRKLTVLSVSGNSMNNAAAGLRYGRTGEHHRFSISLHGSSGKNNYSLDQYPYASGALEHSEFRKFDGLAQWEWRPTSEWRSTFTAYGIAAERNMPSTPFIRSAAHQGDRLWSLSERIERQWGPMHGLILDLHTLLEQIGFRSDPSTEYYLSRARTYNNSLAYTWGQKDLGVTAKLLHSRAIYHSNALLEDVLWDRYQGALRLHVDTNDWEAAVLYTLVTGEDAEPEPLLDVQVSRHWERHKILLQGQKVYRLPTLNERYWYQPGYAYGDSALRPEEGYRIDLYYHWHHDHIKLSINPFSGWYSRMIRWVGVPVRATNVQRVWSRGVDLGTAWSIPLGQAVLVFDQHLHLVRATYDQRGGISPYGMQLAYTPLLSGNLTTSYRSVKWGCYVNQQVVGRNYITSDNSEWLDPYYLLELGGHYRFGQLRLGLLLANLLNAAYETEPYRPLPGRQIHLNLTYQLNTE